MPFTGTVAPIGASRSGCGSGMRFTILIYSDRTLQDTQSDVVGNIEMLYNPTPRHLADASLSPSEFEQCHFPRLAGI